MLRTLLTPTLLVLLGINGRAQSTDLKALNDHFAGALTFKMDRQQRLVIDHFDQGVRFRQDIASPEDLDPELIVYSAEEDAIALKCRADKAQCMSKEIFKLDVVRLTSRVTIAKPAQDTEGGTGIRLLRDFMMTWRAANDQAETPARPVRKNAR